MKEKQVRLLTLGLDNSGKTTIIKSILGQDPTSTSPTLGFTINTLKYKKYFLIFNILLVILLIFGTLEDKQQ